mmetsp:Transcript_97997/g.247297  ORF Transcript_97997/g.247297 Transcript_97997/m.247297 type:complete len:701 (-) Transcript_97997:37-2139(-)
MPSSRIAERFEQCKAAGRTAFVAFVTAGYPTKATTVDALLALEASGADVIELGVPFSDPLADGATIEEASRQALLHDTSLEDCFSSVEAARGKGLKVPVVLMGYYNNFLQHGLDETCADAEKKGVDGFIIVDLPAEQSGDFHPKCVKHNLSLVPIVAPTSTPERMKMAADIADSFIYVVSVLGVTGARAQVSQEVEEVVAGVRKATEGRGISVAVGFGVSQRSHVEAIGKYSDGAVVGSKIVQALGSPGGLACMKDLVKELSGGPLVATSNGHAPAAKRQRVDQAPEGNSAWYFGGKFGGRYIPETLMEAHEELSVAWEKTKKDPAFQAEINRLRTEFVGGPTALYFAKNLTEKLGGAQLWFKREELAHTGAHKINNSLGQALLAKKLGKKRIIAETGAGQHGVATATACALMGLECIVYMGAVDMERQALNVFRMKMLGAKVVPAESGSKTLKDAINEAMRDWVTNIRTTHYIIGSAVGPHPFPDIVRELQAVIGNEARAQMLNQTDKHPTFTNGPGRLPDTVVACVGGGSNAIGMFSAFLEDKAVEIIGVEAGGHVMSPKPDGKAEKEHSATLSAGTPGVLHGSRTYLLQTGNGQITETHSISAGLDYPGVGPQHAWLKDSGRVEYVSVTDGQALDALQTVSRTEGIIPALEPSHALHYSMELCKKMPKDKIVLVNLCGRGDKDMLSVAKALGVQLKD